MICNQCKKECNQTLVVGSGLALCPDCVAFNQQQKYTGQDGVVKLLLEISRKQDDLIKISERIAACAEAIWREGQ